MPFLLITLLNIPNSGQWMDNQKTDYAIEAEQEQLKKFYSKFRARHEILESILAHLDIAPNDVALRAKLYQGVLTTRIQAEKYNLIFLSDSFEFLRQVLQRMKNKELGVDPGFIELMLMVLDELLLVSKEALSNRVIASEVIRKICGSITPLITCSKMEQSEIQRQGITMLLGDFAHDDSSQDVEMAEYEENTDIEGGDSGIDLFDESESVSKVSKEETEDKPANEDEEELFLEDRDMALFRNIADTVEFRNSIWRERDNSIMSIVLGMNGIAKNPVNFEQLEAAVYMRDFGMLRLPDKLFYKEDGLTAADEELLLSHPVLGYEVLARLGGWDEAAAIVLQHQEREDGSGYPEGITGEWICAGAKILAICDAYFQLVNNYQDPDQKRAQIRAMAEINSAKGVLFDAGWVEIFNQVMKIQNRVCNP